MTDTRTAHEVRAFIHGMWADVAATWGRNADEVDQRAAPITARMLDITAPRSGDHVLELACGPGGAGLAAAERVGAAGEVVVSDVVSGMVDIAVQRARDRGLANVRGAVIDLEHIAQPDETYDVVLCREGMMFAVDPALAAREVRRVLRPNGRAAISVWAAREDNPWLALLLDSITEITGIVVPRPGRPGPFALGDANAFRNLFADARFDDIAVERVPAPLHSPSFDAWWQRSRTVAGPIVGVLAGLDDATRDRVRDAARTAVAPFETAGALELPGVALLLSARRPRQ